LETAVCADAVARRYQVEGEIGHEVGRRAWLDLDLAVLLIVHSASPSSNASVG
jgi:hypothetical protein